MATTTTFDIDALVRAAENGQSEPQVRMYAEDAEVTLVDQANPPSNPRKLRGREEIGTWLKDLCERPGMTHKVTRAFVNGDGGAYHLACQYPSGERVSCSATFDLRDGQIVRLDGVQAWDS